jgi:hypothetical protein
MYTLPDDFDPSVFVGRKVGRLSFTSNTLVLSFDGDISVDVESEIRHEGHDEREGWVDAATIPIIHIGSRETWSRRTSER